MPSKKIAALVLIAAGILALVYGGFSYTQETHGVELGSLKFEVKERRPVPVPVWAGVALIAVGVAVLVVEGKGRGRLPFQKG